MITLTKVKEITAAFVKLLRFGQNDVQTSYHLAPYGIESRPISDSDAVHAQTSERGQSVCLGYAYEADNTADGEIRIYSNNIYLHFKNDGTAEFNGDADNMVRFSELKSGFDDLKSKVNNLITSFNTHTHVVPGVTSGPSSTTSAVTTSLETPTTADISGAKIKEIKTL